MLKIAIIALCCVIAVSLLVIYLRGRFNGAFREAQKRTAESIREDDDKLNDQSL